MSETFDPANDAEFDRYAQGYDSMHASSIRASGEAPEYFADYKRRVLERILADRIGHPILDFGCGIGNLSRLLAQAFPSVHGYDPSSRSVKLARERSPGAKFHDNVEDIPRRHFASAVLANVLHHVQPSERDALLTDIKSMLAPGGKLVVFEHNPLNPLTRRAVADCAFDEHAVLVGPWEIVKLLESAGFKNVGRDFIVFFPRPLASLRSLEPRLRWLPIGAQHCAWGTCV